MSTPTLTEDWRADWRDRFAHRFTRGDLLVLRAGLRADDERIGRFASTLPVAASPFLDRPCESCCLLCYPYLVAHPAATVGQVNLEFERLTGRQPSAFVDSLWDNPVFARPEALRLALEEVERSLTLLESPPCSTPKNSAG